MNLESHLSFSFPGKQRKSYRGGYFSSPALLGAWINLYYFWISVPFIIKSLPLQEFSILTMYKNITWSTWSFIPSQWGHTLTSRSPTFPPSSLLVNPELQLNSTNSCQILSLDLRHEGGDEVVQMWSGFWAQLVQKAQGTRVTLQVCSEFTLWFWASSFLPLNLSPHPKRKQFGPDGFKGIFSLSSSVSLWN